MANFRKVMAMKEGDVFIAGILMKGLVDNKKTELNLDKVSWIEEYDKKQSEHKLFMAVFEGVKNVLLYRELKEGE